MLSTVLISILVSGLFSAALVALLRGRLTRQFDEIRRNFGCVREILNSLDYVVKTLNALQLEDLKVRVNRLSLGVTRFQQNTARRLAPLEPLSRELGQAALARELSDRQIFRLTRQWSPAFMLTATEDDVHWLLRALKRTEARWLDDVPADAVDVLARTIAISTLPGPELRVLDVGAGGGLLPLFIKLALSERFSGIQIFHLPAGNLSPAFLRGDSAAILARAAVAAGISRDDAVSVTLDSVRELVPVCDALLLSAGRVGTFSSADFKALLSGVRPSGLVLLGDEDSSPEGYSPEEVVARFQGFETIASCGKTLALRRLP